MISQERIEELDEMTNEELAKDESVTIEELSALLKYREAKVKLVARDIVRIKRELGS